MIEQLLLNHSPWLSPTVANVTGNLLPHVVSVLIVIAIYIPVNIVMKSTQSILDQFEMNLMGYIIDSDNLYTQGPIGEGNHLY